VTGKTERLRRARAVLDHSLEARRLVRITRTIRATEPTDGVVVGHGIRWILISRLSPDLDLDGYTALRWKHVKKVQSFDPSSLAARATMVENGQTVPQELVDTTTTGTLLQSVAHADQPIAVYTERDDPSRRLVGTVSHLVHKTLHLSTVDLSSAPRAEQVVVPFDMITRVDFDGRYLSGLARATRLT